MLPLGIRRFESERRIDGVKGVVPFSFDLCSIPFYTILPDQAAGGYDPNLTARRVCIRLCEEFRSTFPTLGPQERSIRDEFFVSSDNQLGRLFL